MKQANLLICALSLLGAGAAHVIAAGQPNILIIVADDKYDAHRPDRSAAREMGHLSANVSILKVHGNCEQLRAIQ
jgi:hypothetical protein